MESRLNWIEFLQGESEWGPTPEEALEAAGNLNNYFDLLTTWSTTLVGSFAL